jgi:hypothetical protein
LMWEHSVLAHTYQRLATLTLTRGPFISNFCTSSFPYWPKGALFDCILVVLYVPQKEWLHLFKNSLRKVDLLSWFHHWHQHFVSVALLIQMTSILRRVLLHWQQIFASCCRLLTDVFVALLHS